MHRLGFAAERYAGIRDTLLSYGIGEITAMSHWHLRRNRTTHSPGTTPKLGRHGPRRAGHHQPAQLGGNAARAACAQRLGKGGLRAVWGTNQRTFEPRTARPAMRFSSSVIALRNVPTGGSVGYGGRWTAQRDSVIATVPVGYGDGYPWGAADGTPVDIDGQIAPLAGRVSMDMVTVDVTDCSNLSLGAPAVLWGNQPSIDDVAAHSGTIGYELMTRLTPRANRVYHT